MLLLLASPFLATGEAIQHTLVDDIHISDEVSSLYCFPLFVWSCHMFSKRDYLVQFQLFSHLQLAHTAFLTIDTLALSTSAILF